MLRTQPGWALCTHVFPKITMSEGEGESKFQAEEGRKKGKVKDHQESRRTKSTFPYNSKNK